MYTLDSQKNDRMLHFSCILDCGRVNEEKTPAQIQALIKHSYIHQRDLIVHFRVELLKRLKKVPIENENCSICLAKCIDPLICLFCQKEVGCFDCMSEFYENTTFSIYNGTFSKCLKCNRPELKGITTWCKGDRLFLAQGSFKAVGLPVKKVYLRKNNSSNKDKEKLILINRDFSDNHAVHRMFKPVIALNYYDDK